MPKPAFMIRTIKHKILEIVHSDVCGLFLIAPLTKHGYYVIFVDDFSCQCWILFMRKKDQTFSKICEYKALVENDIGRKLKALKSDNKVIEEEAYIKHSKGFETFIIESHV